MLTHVLLGIDIGFVFSCILLLHGNIKDELIAMSPVFRRRCKSGRPTPEFKQTLEEQLQQICEEEAADEMERLRTQHECDQERIRTLQAELSQLLTVDVSCPPLECEGDGNGTDLIN